MRRRVKLLYVLVAAFVIAVSGLLALKRLDQDIVHLEDVSTQMKLEQRAREAEQSKLQKELDIKDTDSYIRNTARSLYGYLMPGEILFRVSNPEALYGEGEMPVLEITEAETEEETIQEGTAG